MDQTPTRAPHTKNRPIEWATAGLIGFFSGFSGIAVRTRMEFREKLLHFVSKTDLIALHNKKVDKNKLIEVLTKDPSGGAAQTLLKEKIVGLETDIKKHIASHSELEPEKESTLIVNGETYVVAKNKLSSLERQKKATEELLTQVETTPLDTMKAKLQREINALDARADIKMKYDAHAKLLDKNAVTRLVDSFDTEADQAVKTNSYLGKGSGLKNKLSGELSQFGKAHLGVESEGLPGFFKGTVQKFEYMSTHSKVGMLASAGIATVIGVAGPIMFFNSLHVQNKLNTLVRNTDVENER